MADIYGAMSNEELMKAATNDIKDLTQEAMEALQEELRKRGLREKVNDAIHIQQKAISAEEFFEYVNLLRTQPCPICASTDRLLNGVILSKIVTAILFSSTHKEFIIGCPACLKQELDKSGGISLSLDFIHMFKGIIETAKVTMEIQNALTDIKEEAPSNALLYFVQKKIGEIELYKTNSQKLQELIRFANASFF